MTVSGPDASEPATVRSLTIAGPAETTLYLNNTGPNPLEILTNLTINDDNTLDLFNGSIHVNDNTTVTGSGNLTVYAGQLLSDQTHLAFGANLTINGGSLVSDRLTLTTAANANIHGGQASTGETSLSSGAQLNLTGGLCDCRDTILTSSAVLNILGGTYRASFIATDGTASINLSGGTLQYTGFGTVNIDDTSGFSNHLALNHNSTLIADNGINFDASMAVTVNGGTLVARSITSDAPIDLITGTVHVTGPGGFTLSDTSGFSNHLNLRHHAAVVADNGLTVDPSMSATLSGGTLDGKTALANAGTIALDAGSLKANSPTGSITNQAGAAIQLGNPVTARIETPLLTNASTLSGTGRITGDFDNAPSSTGGCVNLTGGTLRVDDVSSKTTATPSPNCPAASS